MRLLLPITAVSLAIFGLDLNHVEGWMSTGGALLLFGLLFACGLGLPLPEDIPLMAAGVMIATGKMHWVTAAIAGWCGIIGGDIMLYSLGKRYGLNITRVPMIGKHVTRSRIEWAERLFQRYGVWVVGVGRLFAGIRGAMVVAAGATRYNFTKFLIADGVAALVSGGLWVWLGHWLGGQLHENMHTVEKYKFWVFLGIGVFVLLLGGFLWWRHKVHARRAESEKLDPLTSVDLGHEVPKAANRPVESAP